MSALMGKRASLPNRPSLAVDEAKAATRQARQGRAARQTAALEACLDGLQRELEAARLVEQGARQELEDQRAAFLEEELGAGASAIACAHCAGCTWCG